MSGGYDKLSSFLTCTTYAPEVQIHLKYRFKHNGALV